MLTDFLHSKLFFIFRFKKKENLQKESMGGSKNIKRGKGKGKI